MIIHFQNNKRRPVEFAIHLNFLLSVVTHTRNGARYFSCKKKHDPNVFSIYYLNDQSSSYRSRQLFVNSDICQKLNYYGIKRFMLDWIKSHLTDRLEYVNIGDSYSDTASMKWGVPQGPILAPFYF